MHINQILELSMTLDAEKFQKVLNRAYKKAGYLEDNEGEYVDRSLAHKGITVMYRDSRYKKKVRIIADAGPASECGASDADKFIRKLDKCIKEYLDFKYQMSDFSLSCMCLTVDINVHSKGNVSDYLKVLQRIGRVKGFSPSDYDCFDDIDSFCLDGNSNGMEFLIYDLEGLIKGQLNGTDIGRKKIKTMIMDAEGILRAEVRLTALVPEKKSLLLAQKAMNCRNVEKVMEAFAKINVSPVTISKRQDIKWLKNVYEYLLEK